VAHAGDNENRTIKTAAIGRESCFFILRGLS